MNARLIPGLLLIALGMVMLLAQFFEFGPGLLLLFFGLLFFIAYGATRSFGLLIPACILAGLGIGIVVGRAPMREDASVLLGLGLGFIAIFVIQLVVAGRSHWWPLVPGGLLVLAGLAEAVPEGQVLVERGWPLVLILIGLAILAAQFRMSLPGSKNRV